MENKIKVTTTFSTESTATEINEKQMTIQEMAHQIDLFKDWFLMSVGTGFHAELKYCLTNDEGQFIENSINY